VKQVLLFVTLLYLDQTCYICLFSGDSIKFQWLVRYARVQ